MIPAHVLALEKDSIGMKQHRGHAQLIINVNIIYNQCMYVQSRDFHVVEVWKPILRNTVQVPGTIPTINTCSKAMATHTVKFHPHTLPVFSGDLTALRERSNGSSDNVEVQVKMIWTVEYLRNPCSEHGWSWTEWFLQIDCNKPTLRTPLCGIMIQHHSERM